MKTEADSTQNGTQTITVAELCAALENGTLAAQLEDDMYVIRQRDLIRLANPYSPRQINPRQLLLSLVQKAS